MQDIFDEAKTLQMRSKAMNARNTSQILHLINNDLIYRLQSLQNKFDKVLIIGFGLQDLENELKKNFSPSDIRTYNIDQITKINNDEKFDLIIFPCSLYSINNVQLFLLNIANILSDSGLFIANFPGELTLRNLRRQLINSQAKDSPHYNFIAPFIRFQHVTRLLQQAHFIESIIDLEEINLDYPSALALLNEIKYIGENNVLFKPKGYLINKQMYQYLANCNERFIDKLDLINFIASKKRGVIKIRP